MLNKLISYSNIELNEHLNFINRLYKEIFILLFGNFGINQPIQSGIPRDLNTLVFCNISDYSQYLYTYIIQNIIMEEFNFQILNLKEELKNVKLDNENLKIRINFLERNGIISYNYKEIKNRKINLHKELKRIYRLINRSSDIKPKLLSEHNFVIPFAKIVD